MWHVRKIGEYVRMYVNLKLRNASLMSDQKKKGKKEKKVSKSTLVELAFE